MKVFYGIKKIKKYTKPVVALGIFDGVHRGHRYLLRKTVKKARSIRGTSMVITFYPHPQKEESLYSLQHRLRLIAELGLDVCIVITFDPVFANLSAEDFIKKILVDKIGARFIFIGSNYKFGKNAAGDVKLLAEYAQLYNFGIKTFKVIKSRQQTISSTIIRRLIKSGKLQQAKEMLERPVSVLGTVVKGISLAGKLGFPTANIDPHHEVLPPAGVYAVRVFLGKRHFDGVCNVGKKPTLKLSNDLRNQKHVEVYIMGFRSNIYGKDLEIHFMCKLRNEKKFPSFGLLTKQIKKDIIKAKKFLSYQS